MSGKWTQAPILQQQPILETTTTCKEKKISFLQWSHIVHAYKPNTGSPHSVVGQQKVTQWCFVRFFLSCIAFLDIVILFLTCISWLPISCVYGFYLFLSVSVCVYCDLPLSYAFVCVWNICFQERNRRHCIE